MSSKLLIKNAKIVSPNKVIAGHLLIEDGKIAQIGDIEFPKDCDIIDADNNYLLPGGIDAHVHFDLKTPNGRTADDFESGSKAALAGGTTSIIDFITPSRESKLQEAFEHRLEQAKDSYTDFSFHQSITSWDDSTAQQMEDAVEIQGITSFKTYLTYSSSIGIGFEILEKVMIQAAKLKAIVLVHAEMGDINDQLAEEYKDSKKSPGYIHKKTHPVESEVQAIQEVLKLTQKTGCKTYIVHVSTQGGMQAIIDAKKQGLPVYAETCPQYFSIHDNIYSKNNSASVECILSPPLRPINHMEYILQSIAKGDVDCLSTDHCSFSWKHKNQENYFNIPHGIGGVQYRMQLSHQYLVGQGMISWLDFAKLTAENPAIIFGLSNKGKIEVGYDADLVLMKTFDKKTKISSFHDYSKSDINVFGNLGVWTKIQVVIKNGKLVFDKNRFNKDLTKGQFIHRK